MSHVLYICAICKKLRPADKHYREEVKELTAQYVASGLAAEQAEEKAKQEAPLIIHFGPMKGTNNIGEFLAIVHALALCWQQGLHDKTIYSDSYNAILWVNKRQCKTKLERTPETEPLYQIILRAENWLRTHNFRNPIIKWETSKWGEVPADFGRK